tara:strand:+ start:58 stop:1008 length:951 start_codon:yes stop_codon:yes gene_type:complete
MKYLVTGGAGFIGSNLVDRLIDQGHEVVVIDNESSESHDQFYWNEKAENHKLDIAEYDDILPLFDGVDVVFHCAAQSRIQICVGDPTTAAKTNMLGTCCVLQAAKESGVGRVVYSSTSSAYGLTNNPPNVETQPDDCLNPYSVSKVAGEKLCSMYSKLFGLETVILRYFNVYGKRHALRGQYAPVVGRFLDQEVNGEPLTIVPDGNQRRDYTHVDDVVQANVLASAVELDKLFDPDDIGEYRNVGYGEVFNVGTGTNTSVNELAEMISENTIMIDPRPGEARVTLANNNKIKDVMKWSPTVRLEDWVEEEKKRLGL